MPHLQVDEDASYVMVHCPEQVDENAGAELLQLAQEWIKNPNRLYVLNFKKSSYIDKNFYRPVMLFHQALKKHNCYLSSINIGPDLLAQIKADGVENVFTTKKDIHSALNTAGVKVNRSEIYAKFAAPFIKATQETLSIQCSLTITSQKPKTKEPQDVFNTYIAGVLSLTSPAFRGTLALCFPLKVFLQIYAALTGEKHESITPEMEDCAGEILNIIFGQAKASLNETEGFQIEKAIPAVLVGGDLRVHHQTRNKALLMPFEMAGGGRFHLEISADPT